MNAVLRSANIPRLLITFSLILLTLILTKSRGVAGDYLGEYTWKLTFPPVTTEYAVLKLALTHMGDGHNLCNGTVTNFEDGVQKGTDVLHGNSETAGTITTMTLLNSFFVPSVEYGYSVIHIQIDSTTLNGTSRTINSAHQFTSGQITQEFAQGNVEFITKSEAKTVIKGDFDGNGKLGLEDSIGILQTVSGLRTSK